MVQHANNDKPTMTSQPTADSQSDRKDSPLSRNCYLFHLMIKILAAFWHGLACIIEFMSQINKKVILEWTQKHAF